MRHSITTYWDVRARCGCTWRTNIGALTHGTHLCQQVPGDPGDPAPIVRADAYIGGPGEAFVYGNVGRVFNLQLVEATA